MQGFTFVFVQICLHLPSHNASASPSFPGLTFHTQALGCKENKHAKNLASSLINQTSSGSVQMGQKGVAGIEKCFGGSNHSVRGNLQMSSRAEKSRMCIYGGGPHSPRETKRCFVSPGKTQLELCLQNKPDCTLYLNIRGSKQQNSLCLTKSRLEVKIYKFSKFSGQITPKLQSSLTIT